MSNGQDRRAPTEGRVSLETLVEICGNQPGIPAFEAEAVDVSARGMHLRTAYLPDEGAPLVCRFENDGQEVVVEGVVAWRKEGSRGGEFGVRFTALDSRSVDVLRGLVAESVKSESAVEGSEPGARVRLHIDGLGSPMKARVRTSNGARKVEVGSNLEFLKVGRKLEIEDLEAGARRNALIDGVDVVIDPSTRVPQLVVALRYEGFEEDTPQPSVTDLGGAPSRAPERLRIDGAAVTTSAHERAEKHVEPPADEDSVGAAEAEQEDELEDAFRGRLGTLAGGAGKFAAQAGSALQRASASTFRGVGQLFQGASGKIAALREKNAASAQKRTTAAPPGGPVSIEGKRLRQQPSEPTLRPSALGSMKKMPAKKKLAIGAGTAVVLVSVLAVALKPASAPPPGASTNAAGAPLEVEAAGSASPQPAALSDTAATPLSGAQNGQNGLSANVPLFGPTPMATTEPAPLGPSGEDQAVEEAEMAEAKASARPQVADEEFVDAPEVEKPRSKKSASSESTEEKKEAASTKRPEDVTPWGRGKMKLPTIHRLRLDGPGAEIRGESEATGFTVLIPGRKVMEKAAGLAKRDDRIARVRANNTPGGAQIRLEFKDGAPAYRVRLRRDFVELLISAPAEAPKKN
jgi:hypothetical protein